MSVTKALIVDDSEEDALSISHAIVHSGDKIKYSRIDNPVDLKNAFKKQWDIVLSDFHLRHFTGPEVLSAVHNAAPDLPFILVANNVPEDAVIDLMKAGARDYVSKRNLKRLSPIVARELRNAARQKEIKQANEKITEQNKIWAALRDRETWLSLIYDSVSDVIFVIDVEPHDNFRFKSVNRRFPEVTGLSENQIVGKLVQEIIPEPARDMVLGKYKEAIKTGHSVHWEEVSSYPAGIKYGEVTVAPILDANGNCTQLIGTVHDITEHKAADDKLKESEKKYRTLYETMVQGVIYHDADGKITSINPAGERILGITLEQMQSGTVKNSRGGIQEDGSEVPMENNPAFVSLKTGKPVHDVIMGIFNPVDQTYHWLNENAVPQFRPGENRPYQVYSTFEDITERKKAEEQLRLQAQLLDAQMDEVFVHDGDGNIIFANMAASSITGYTRDELLKMNIRQLDTPEMAEQIPSRKMIVDKRGFNTFETIHRNKNGTLIPFEVHSIATEWQGQKIILSVDRDITVRKQMEEKLKQSYEQLQKNFGAITQTITSTVELRDPYTAGHQGRVAHLAQAIAREMNLAEEQANQIYTAGLIHDIGKISIPAEILSKAGKLNDIEFSLIKMHSQSGYDVLKNIEFPYPMAQWVLEHHERMNGSGYPYGLTGDKIGLEARIIAVADVVEAMSSHRPYRAALGIDAALAEIKKNKGILYDSAAVEACLRLFNEKGFKLE